MAYEELSYHIENNANLELINALENVKDDQDLLNRLLFCCVSHHNSKAINIVTNAGADVNAVGEFNRTPIMVAAIQGSCEIVKVLLSNEGLDLKIEDDFGCNACHYIYGCATNEYGFQILKELKDHPTFNHGLLTHENKSGHTALQYIASEEALRAIFPLENDISVRRHEKDEEIYFHGTTLSQLVMKYPDFSKEVLNQYIEYIGFGKYDPELKIKFNFKLFYFDILEALDAPLQRFGTLLEAITKHNPDLLEHCLVKVFIKNKRQSLIKYFNFLFSFIVFSFMVLYTVFMLTIRSKYVYHFEEELFNFYNRCNYIALIFLLQFLGILSIFSIKSSPYRLILYIYWAYSFASYLHVSLDVWWSLNCVGMFLAWLNMFITLRNYSYIGMYVLMFTHILRTFVTVMIPLLFILSVFILGFNFLHLNENDDFGTLTKSFFKCISLLIGSVDANEIDGSLNITIFQVASIFTFLSFVVCITIISSNLLIGIVISDVADVKRAATKLSLELCAKQCLTIDRILKFFCLEKYIYSETTVTMRPNLEKRKSCIQRLAFSVLGSGPLDEDIIVQELLSKID